MIIVYGVIYIATLIKEIILTTAGLLLIAQPELLKILGVMLQPTYSYCNRIIRGQWLILWLVIEFLILAVQYMA